MHDRNLVYISDAFQVGKAELFFKMLHPLGNINPPSPCTHTSRHVQKLILDRVKSYINKLQILKDIRNIPG